jgi:hypothetical protein
VKNTGLVGQPRPATVTGIQNGVEVYRQSLMVWDPPGSPAIWFEFPSYAPTALGDITWTVTIAGDPGLATRQSKVCQAAKC